VFAGRLFGSALSLVEKAVGSEVPIDQLFWYIAAYRKLIDPPLIQYTIILSPLADKAKRPLSPTQDSPRYRKVSVLVSYPKIVPDGIPSGGILSCDDI